MTRIEKDLIKERLLTELYSKVGLTPSDQELDASHVAISDELVEKLHNMASSLLKDGTNPKNELQQKGE